MNLWIKWSVIPYTYWKIYTKVLGKMICLIKCKCMRDSIPPNYLSVFCSIYCSHWQNLLYQTNCLFIKNQDVQGVFRRFGQLLNWVVPTSPNSGPPAETPNWLSIMVQSIWLFSLPMSSNPNCSNGDAQLTVVSNYVRKGVLGNAVMYCKRPKYSYHLANSIPFNV